jgi:surface polysaccharide O-acyltransferase-like enzyme
MFLRYIHSFRALAIIFIVAAHCIALFDWASIPWQRHLVLSLIPNGTVFFVFIAGFLFQHLSYKFEYRRYLKSKLQNVMLPYVIVSLPMIAVQALTQSGSFDPAYIHHWPTVAQNVAWSLLTGSHTQLHLWFIPMIAIFYLLAPLLLWIDRDGRPYYLLPLLLTVTVCVHRPSNFDNIWQSCAYYLPVYVYGMWFSRHRERLLAWHDRWLPALFASVAGLVWLEVAYLHQAGYIVSASMFSTEHGIVDTNAMQKLLLCGVLLVVLRRLGEGLHGKLRPVADASFAIYFLHLYFVKGFANLMGGQTSPGAGLWQYWLALAVVVTVCVGYPWFGTQVMSRLSRYVVGAQPAANTWAASGIGAQQSAASVG